jgi:hypothetical protein
MFYSPASSAKLLVYSLQSFDHFPSVQARRTLRPAAFLRRKVPTGVDRLSSMRRNDAPLSLGKDFLRGVTGWRGDNAISFADHFHGLALIQITTESAIRQITVHEACDRTRERFRTAQHVHSVLLCTNYSVRDGRKRANQNQGSQHFVSIGFFGRIVQTGRTDAAPDPGASKN